MATPEDANAWASLPIEIAPFPVAVVFPPSAIANAEPEFEAFA